METQEYLVSDDIGFQSFNEILSSESSIKREVLKDEDDILLFAQLDNITNNIAANSTDFQITQAADDVVHHVPNQVHDISTGMLQQFDNKLPMDLTKIPTVPGIPSESHIANGTSHYVRYKLQDGKHVKIWECGICSKEFTHQYTLMRHLPTHTDERKFQCNTCGKAFRQMSTLSQHRAIHSTERPYVCEICQKNFNRISTLISHRKTHTGLKPYQCHLCTKAFHQKGNLRNHIFTHTNERPYKCDICGKGFNQMSNLMCHKLKAHQRTEKPKYVCQICGKCFLKRMGLRHHEQCTHGMITDSIAVPQIPEKPNYMNAIIVDPIKTEAMRLAIESNQTPFALLRPLTGIPVLVRVLPAGEKQMLVPASAEDLKRHSHISITNKADKENIDSKEFSRMLDEKNEKPVGSTVQIKIPVVATVIQQNDQGGQMSMSVVSPGPNGEFVDQSGMMNSKIDSFVYSSTLTNTETSPDDVVEIDSLPITNDLMRNADIHFFGEDGRLIDAKIQENLKVVASEEVICGSNATVSCKVFSKESKESLVLHEENFTAMEIETNLF